MGSIEGGACARFNLNCETTVMELDTEVVLAFFADLVGSADFCGGAEDEVSGLPEPFPEVCFLVERGCFAMELAQC